MRYQRWGIDVEAPNLPLVSVFDENDLDSCLTFFKRRFSCVFTCSHPAGLRCGRHDSLTLRWLALLQVTETSKPMKHTVELVDRDRIF